MYDLKNMIEQKLEITGVVTCNIDGTSIPLKKRGAVLQTRVMDAGLPKKKYLIKFTAIIYVHGGKATDHS